MFLLPPVFSHRFFFVLNKRLSRQIIFTFRKLDQKSTRFFLNQHRLPTNRDVLGDSKGSSKSLRDSGKILL